MIRDHQKRLYTLQLYLYKIFRKRILQMEERLISEVRDKTVGEEVGGERLGRR